MQPNVILWLNMWKEYCSLLSAFMMIIQREISLMSACALCTISDYHHPQSAVSIGIICFFLDIMPGRKSVFSFGSAENACWIASSFPT